MKSNITTEEPLCLSCLKPLQVRPIRRIVEKKPLLCDSCLSRIDFRLSFRSFHGAKVFFLFSYSGLMKELLLQYKERKDVALAPVFLSFGSFFLRQYLKRKTIVPVPSSFEKEEERGFQHLGLILQAHGIPYQNLLRKKKGVQKEKGFLDRRKTSGIELKLPNIFTINKSIVIFDDVMTSGETFKQCINCLSKEVKHSITGLVLMDNHFQKNVGFIS